MSRMLTDAERALRLAQRLDYLGRMLDKHGRAVEKAATQAAKKRDPSDANRFWQRVAVHARSMEIYAVELLKVSKDARVTARRL